MKKLHTWHVTCNHTPEIIDRIILPIRKRGLMLAGLQYRQESEKRATCILEFEETDAVAEQIYKNLVRTLDIDKVDKIERETA